VQWVNRASIDFRGFSGTLASGTVSVGDEVLVAASRKPAQIARIVTMDGDLPNGHRRAGRHVGARSRGRYLARRRADPCG
jgi:sulfate adenylyltransferase subunit 1 (EFTu-like GTPase family)